MKKIILALVIITVSISAQVYENCIIGRILERQTGKPLPGVNVYLNDTGFGTTTDEKGHYKIYSIIPGNHELVASMIGFEIYTNTVQVKADSKISMNIFMDEHVYEFGEVEVTAEKSVEWQENYKIFQSIFLGNTAFANECDIVNKYYINFEQKDNLLIAHAPCTLVIENNALGYTIQCDLIQFQYNDALKDSKFVVKTFFKDMETEEDIKIDGYKSKRKLAYYGSLQHFLTSAIQKNVVNEGYQIRLISKPANDTNLPPGFRIASITDLIKPDELGLFYKFSFDNYLQVKYDDPENDIYELSFLKLNFPEVYLDENGIALEVMPFQTMGTWARDGIADMLPKYFSPLKQ